MDSQTNIKALKYVEACHYVILLVPASNTTLMYYYLIK